MAAGDFAGDLQTVRDLIATPASATDFDIRVSRLHYRTDQHWLRVTDNGVYMTEKVIKNYFTQIGKSYYRSPEFNQERAAIKAAGEVVSPIASSFISGTLEDVATTHQAV